MEELISSAAVKSYFSKTFFCKVFDREYQEILLGYHQDVKLCNTTRWNAQGKQISREK